MDLLLSDRFPRRDGSVAFFPFLCGATKGMQHSSNPSKGFSDAQLHTPPTSQFKQ
jgi:hypothetical protein